MTSTQPTSSTIKAIVRQFTSCWKKHPDYDQYCHKCGCRKSLYIYEDGAKTVVRAKIRKWEDAGEFAEAERDRRRPVTRRNREIEEQEAHKNTLQQTQDITVLDAAERWVASQKQSWFFVKGHRNAGPSVAA
jgi:predicted  nucleic acid-binding Zn-ribbon protein